MPVIENCMHCGKLCTDGFCPCRWPISVESMFDIIGPAPKEEGMDLVKTNCKTCGIPLLNSEVCYKCSDRTAERRALYREAYMAALGGSSTDIDLSAAEHVRFAAADALETVRQWPAMMAELDNVLREVEG